MKEFLQSLFKSTEERIKNPFIGAFITSWVIFNWKSILYIIFADNKIEDRIEFIMKHYSNVWNCLWLPLFSAVFYIVVLPYVSFIFEFFVKFSHKWRNKVSLDARAEALELQVGIARNEITLEEKKTEFRERNSHNQMVENLQNQVKILTERLDESSKNYQEVTNMLNDQNDNLSKNMQTINETYSQRINEITEELKIEQKRSRDLNSFISEKNSEINEINDFVKDLEKKLSIELFKNDRIKDSRDKIIKQGSHYVLETFNTENKPEYFDLTYSEFLSIKQFKEIFNKDNHATINDYESVENAKRRMEEFINKSGRIE